jgi:hypothetical protein
MLKTAIKKILGPRVKESITNSWGYRISVLKLNYYLVLKLRLKKNLNSLNVITPEKIIYKKHRILVPLIETSHYNFYQILIVAKALELRGHEVKLLLCGSSLDGCEIKSVRNVLADPCLTCRFNKNNVVPFFKFEINVLADYLGQKDRNEIEIIADDIIAKYPNKYYFMDVEIIGMTNDSVVRYFYGGVPNEGSEELNSIRRRFLVTAMIGVLVSSNIDKQWSPTIIFNNMNVYSDWNPYYSYFKLKGAQLNTLSISQFNYNSQLLNYSDLFSSSERFIKWLEVRNYNELDELETIEITRFLNERFAGKAQVFKQYDFFDNTSITSKFFTINPSKRNIFLFSNVFWDVGINNDSALYTNVIDWVLDSIEIVANNSSCHLYIKPHPAEKYDSGATSIKGVIDYIFERFSTLPSNVTIIYPEYKLNTYQLFPLIDLGVVYNGTLGIEMMVNDIQVVSCGKGPYTGAGLVIEPSSRNEYCETLLNPVKLEKPTKEMAQLFAYFYFIKTLIPWKLTKKAYGDSFDGYTIDSLDKLLPGNDRYLDHLCNCILNADETVIENW